MGYQFTNNWPYSTTVFPSMTDHVDPVNQEYFDGLHQELDTMESYLGIHPQGAAASVAARLLAEEARITALENQGGVALISDVWLPPKDGLPASDPATLKTTGPGMYTLSVWEHAASGDTGEFYQFLIPSGGNSKDFDIDIYYTGAGSGTTDYWELLACTYPLGGSMGSYTDTLTGLGAGVPSANWCLKKETFRWTADSLVTGAFVTLRVYRKAENVKDTNSNVNYVLGVRVHEHV